MPTAYVSKMADKHGISVSTAEHKWARAKELAGEKVKHGSKRFWALTMGIFKRMLGEEGAVTFKEWTLLEDELLETISIPKLTKDWPAEDIIRSTSYTLHRMPSKKASRAVYEIRRLMDDPEDEALARVYMVKHGERVLWQVELMRQLQQPAWAKRSQWVELDSPMAADFDAVKKFVLRVLRDTGTISESRIDSQSR